MGQWKKILKAVFFAAIFLFSLVLFLQNINVYKFVSKWTIQVPPINFDFHILYLCQNLSFIYYSFWMDVLNSQLLVLILQLINTRLYSEWIFISSANYQ